MDPVVYTLFFEYTMENKLEVMINTRVGSVTGYIKSINNDGVFLQTRDERLYAIGFSDMCFTGTIEPVKEPPITRF